MQILSVQNFTPKRTEAQSFGSAKDMTLDYLIKNRGYLIPKRVLDEAKARLHQTKVPTLRDLHKELYAKLLDYKNLDDLRNDFPEFGKVLQLNALVERRSPNIKKLEKAIPLEDFTLYVLKNRWAKLKTKDEIAQTLGLKDRSSLQWFLEKTHIPDLGNNYQILLKASDPALNAELAKKAAQANGFGVIGNNTEINSRTWELLPDLRHELAVNRGYGRGFWTEENKALWAEARKVACAETYGKK